MNNLQSLMDEFFETTSYDKTGRWQDLPESVFDPDAVQMSAILKWDESQHPRNKAGSPNGGEFVASGVSGAPEFAWRLETMYEQQGTKDWEADYLDSLALKKYFGNADAFLLNSRLRKGEKPGKLADIDKALKKGFEDNDVMLPADTHLFRMVGGDAAHEIAALQPGETFKDNAYVSTTTLDPVKHGSTAYGDNFSTVLHITLEHPMKALGHKKESEFLLQPGRTFRVLSKKVQGSRRVVNVVMT